MNNNTVNKALLDLEKGLKEVDSARTQVADVTKQSQELIKAFKDILTTIKSVSKELNERESLLSDEVKNAASELDEHVNSTVALISKANESNKEKLDKSINGSIDALKSLRNEVNNLKSEVRSLSEKTRLVDFNKMLDDVKENIELKSASQVEAIEGIHKIVEARFSSLAKKQQRHLLIEVSVLIVCAVAIVLFLYFPII